MRKSKNRYFYHIFVSPGDVTGAITLNVVWMEREFDAYKLSSCICPFNYNRFWDRARYLWKIVILSYPLAFDANVIIGGFPSEYRHPLWYGKTRMVSLPDGGKISKICLFVLTWSTNVTDGQTLHDSKDRACIASRGKNRAVGMLKLTTDKHEASCGLFATAELLVSADGGPILIIFRRLVQNDMSTWWYGQNRNEM